ncbi:Quinolinate phosphoribosyl transferase [Lactarius akahatsu]|uniref:Nicotinate-nucleotide pyrophosphorylase [carboxylating] n=1 Tax=Lactarius akahatsu TaxID=416441 RepID=A0AAD4Q8G4_9AGAM|nr:Quinolinate phosphoribosyl transferase [Lactarius akahatsu]
MTTADLSSGKLLARKGSKRAVLAGTPFVDEISRLLDCTVEWNVPEGDEFEPIKHVATVRGKARYFLLGERIALNLLARCSGIATAELWLGFRGVIAGTRKTTPGIYTASWARTSFHNADVSLLGFRLVEKYGMIVGGIDPHRFDLSSMIMFKDNHIWSAGSVTAAISRAREVGGFSLLLDVEVRDEEEANEAIAAGADVIMLDNIEGGELVSVARRLRDRWAGKGKKFLLETSGGITEGNLRERAISGIDILSTSSVHQSLQHIDFSLKIQVPPS